jgi:hypothetical protein
MIGYKNLSDEDLKDLLRSDYLGDSEKYDILMELLERGAVVLESVETIY